MKKILSLLLALLVCLAFSVSALAQEEAIVYVNGNQLITDVPAVIENGTTMLPFRAILNALGVKDEDIKWHENSKSIEIRTEGKYIFLAIGSAGAIVDNNLITLNVAPYIVNNRTLIPVRFISEAMGASVSWDEETKSVKIIK